MSSCRNKTTARARLTVEYIMCWFIDKLQTWFEKQQIYRTLIKVKSSCLVAWERQYQKQGLGGSLTRVSFVSTYRKRCMNGETSCWRAVSCTEHIDLRLKWWLLRWSYNSWISPKLQQRHSIFFNTTESACIDACVPT